jgi:hypothetical protein
MRFVIRSLRMDMGPEGRTGCYKLLKQLHDMILDFRKKSRFRMGCIEKFSVTHKKKQSLCIYGSRILFIILILKGKETITVIDDSRVLKDLLPEMGYRKEWDDKKYGKMVKRGKEIADTIMNSFSSKSNLT